MYELISGTYVFLHLTCAVYDFDLSTYKLIQLFLAYHIYFSIFRYFYEYSLGNYGIISSIWYLFSFELGCETLPQIFHTTSIWLTLALATQRWIFVCKPEAAKVWCTLENTKWGIAAIFCLLCLHQITR